MIVHGSHNQNVNVNTKGANAPFSYEEHKMKVFGISEINFYTEEHELNNYIHFFDSLQKAQDYVLQKYGVNCEENETVVYRNEEDDEYGERSVLIEQIKVQ